MRYIIALPLLFLAMPCLTSCSVVGEAASISMNKARELPAGAAVEGEGFTVKAPRAGFYAQRAKGMVVFRETGSLALDTCYVGPVSWSPSPRNTDEAAERYNETARRSGEQVMVVKKSRSTWRGHPVTRTVILSPDGSSLRVAAIAFVQRGDRFLVFYSGRRGLSSGMSSPAQSVRTVEACEEGLAKLMGGTQLK